MVIGYEDERGGESSDFGAMPGCVAGGLCGWCRCHLSWGQDKGGKMHAGACE